MKNVRSIFLTVILAFITCGCTLREKKPVFDVKQSNIQADFERAMKKLDEEKPADAAVLLEKILVQSPATEFDFIVLFNLGVAKETLKDCRGAADHYREVARGSSGKFRQIEAMSFLRLGYVYECLGKDDRVMSALLDAQRRKDFLPEDTAKSELPARIAAVYARTGNKVEAQKYFNVALEGIKFLQVKHKNSKVLADTLAQSLFFMGHGQVAESEFLKNPIVQIRGLTLMQIYLLQAAELGSSKWSGRAVDEIMNSYQRIWRFGQKVSFEKDSDAYLTNKKMIKAKTDVYRESLKSVRFLKRQRMPKRQEVQEVERLFAFLDNEEAKLLAAMDALGVENPLTPESQKRQSVKVEGKVKSEKESPLEQKQR